MDGFDGRPTLGKNAWAELGQLTFGELIERIASDVETSSAIELYRDWIALHGRDGDLVYAAWFNLGVELARVGRRDDAMLAYRRALALRPDFHAAAINLGLSLEQGGQLAGALACWAGAVQPDEARTALLNQRARALEQAGRFAEAEAELRRSLLTDPRQPDAAQHWLHLRQKMCLWPVLDETIPGLPRAAMLEQFGPIGMLALTDDVAVQTANAAAWLARKAPAAPARLSPPNGYAARQRIRIGYLSSDFCRHALSLLMAELFERHDRARFEVFGYCASPEDGSDIRSRVIAAFDRFTRVRDLDDEGAARLIRADEIDILVDLNGLTAGSRIGVLRWRPAPVQATYLGFVGPVPLPELDYMFCDDIVIPPGIASLYRPAPLAVAPIYQANDSRAEIAAPMTRAQAGLPERRFVFANFSNSYKITESQFALWMAILARTPDSVLWLVADNEWSVRHLSARASVHGVDPARLIFAGRVAPETYRARMALADLLLDTFPYTSGTVASDAIRMGLPLLTLAGQSFASRMSARLLLAIGAGAGVTRTPEEYVARAVALAGDLPAHAAFRALFSQARWAATIGDIAGFTSAYEATLQRIRAPLTTG